MHGVCKADLIIGNLNNNEIATEFIGNFIEHPSLFDKRQCMTEQNITVADGDDIVMKHARVDNIRILLREYDMPCVEPVQTRNRPRGFKRLPGREFHRLRRSHVKTARTIDKELHTALAVLLAKTRVISRPFIAELRATRQRSMM